jgi:hypothetical protein
MPGYTAGLFVVVPFLYAALKLHLRKLWWLTAGYGVLWIGIWVALAVSPDTDRAYLLGNLLLIAAATLGTAHAFVLRQTLPRTGGGSDQQQLEAAQPNDPAQITLTQLQAALASLKSYVASHADRLPLTCNQLLNQTIACMEQVLAFVATGGHADTELASVHAMLSDYLPTSIHTYVRLPRDYASSQRNPDGRTAAEELELQLRLLRDNAKEAANSLYRGDALRLQEQSQFLQSKFGTSELDLP